MSERARVESKEEIEDRIRAENPEVQVASFGKGRAVETVVLKDEARETWIAEQVETEHARQTKEQDAQTERDDRALLIAALEAGTATTAQTQTAVAVLLREMT